MHALNRSDAVGWSLFRMNVDGLVGKRLRLEDPSILCMSQDRAQGSRSLLQVALKYYSTLALHRADQRAPASCLPSSPAPGGLYDVIYVSIF